MSPFLYLFFGGIAIPVFDQTLRPVKGGELLEKLKKVTGIGSIYWIHIKG
jgi:hypothetical protein